MPEPRANGRVILAARPPVARCPAPKILTPEACSQVLEAGARVCSAHADTDPTRQCEAEAGPRTSRVRVPCHAWPLAGSAFCRAHDPVARAERQAERESLIAQLGRLRQLVSAAVAVKVLELLVLRRKVTVSDVAAVLAEYRVRL